MNGFHFSLHSKDHRTHARTGYITTPHGIIHTPAFVPVGTQATVKSVTPQELTEIDVELFFVNTYHLYLRPGIQKIQEFGGVHTFMHWNKPLMSDSGGFQIFSFGKGTYLPQNVAADETPLPLVRITDEGVRFQSHWDGSSHFFTPDRSMAYQWAIGADIHIVFDDCTPFPVTHSQAEKSLARTHRWAVESLTAHNILAMEARKKKGKYQAIYGSVQGSIYQDLREKSAQYLSTLDFDGIAIGGVSVGESKQEMKQVLDWVCPYLPENLPRHLLGVGEIDDIFILIEHGIDTFDCVQPTRLARVGRLYFRGKQEGQSAAKLSKNFTLDITNAQWASDTRAIDPSCRCFTCTNFSRGYIHHLFRVRELLGYRLATIHNVSFITSMVSKIRKAIVHGKFLEMKREWLYNSDKRAVMRV